MFRAAVARLGIATLVASAYSVETDATGGGSVRYVRQSVAPLRRILFEARHNRLRHGWHPICSPIDINNCLEHRKREMAEKCANTKMNLLEPVANSRSCARNYVARNVLYEDGSLEGKIQRFEEHDAEILHSCKNIRTCGTSPAITVVQAGSKSQLASSADLAPHKNLPTRSLRMTPRTGALWAGLDHCEAKYRVLLSLAQARKKFGRIGCHRSGGSVWKTPKLRTLSTSTTLRNL